MDAIGILYLAMALAAVAAAMGGFFALFGKGPRGSVLTVAACPLVWGIMLLLTMRDPDSGTLPRELDLLATVLWLSGAIGGILGVFDLFQRRPGYESHTGLWILRQPLIWGGGLFAVYYELLVLGVINQPMIVRYCASHPVEHAETAMFFVGLAALVIRYFMVTGQSRSMRLVSLEPIPTGGQHVADCDRLLSRLVTLPGALQQSYLVTRLRDALDFVRRKGSADSLDGQLRHLEELDLARMYAGYSLVRIIIWAIPILGFLGTVIGITMAIASLSPAALESSMPEVTAGLGVAFDTTALALTLSMILMFGKFWVERTEDHLLAAVDARVAEELVGRFPQGDTESDPGLASIRRMSEQVLNGVEAMASRQAQVWKSTFDETHEQLAEVTLAAGKIVKDSLSTALRETLNPHAQKLGETLDRHAKALGEHAAAFGKEVCRHADRLNASASQHAAQLNQGAQQTVARLREGLEKLAELLVEALEQHGQSLAANEKGLAEENRRHLAEVEAAVGEAMVLAADRQERLIAESEKLLQEMQAALAEASHSAVRQQEELVKQGNVLLQVVGATGQVKKLEDSLNQNLDALRRNRSFEDVVLSLTAAIELLHARLGDFPDSSSAVDYPGDEPTSRAA